VRGWNECLVTYLLAVAAPRHAVDAASTIAVRRPGTASSTAARTTASSCRWACRYGGPLFFTHYSFCGLDPRGLKDRYADYWDLNCRHVRINRAALRLPIRRATRSTAKSCWGPDRQRRPRTAYLAHAPATDNGTDLADGRAGQPAVCARRGAAGCCGNFRPRMGTRLWKGFGFVDAFCERRGWFAQTFSPSTRARSS
jgi:hypothetical protein